MKMTVSVILIALCFSSVLSMCEVVDFKTTKMVLDLLDRAMMTDANNEVLSDLYGSEVDVLKFDSKSVGKDFEYTFVVEAHGPAVPFACVQIKKPNVGCMKVLKTQQFANYKGAEVSCGFAAPAKPEPKPEVKKEFCDKKDDKKDPKKECDKKDDRKECNKKDDKKDCGRDNKGCHGRN